MERIKLIFQGFKAMCVDLWRVFLEFLEFFNPFVIEYEEYEVPSDKKEDYTDIIKRNEEAEKFSGE